MRKLADGTARPRRLPTGCRRQGSPGLSTWPSAPAALVLQFAPTREGFLRFMVESKVVYDAFEDIMQQAPVDYCERGRHPAGVALACFSCAAFPVCHACVPAACT